MRYTALKMAKNQGLVSVSQNKKIKNKKFRDKAAEGYVGISGGGRVRKRGRKIVPFTGTRGGFNTSVFVPYVTKPPRSPRGRTAGGAAAGLLRGCCYVPTGAGAAAAGLLLRGRAQRSGAGGLRPANG